MLINWRTTAVGATLVIVWLLKLIFGIQMPTEVMEGITAILMALGLYFSKDRQVTGGTIMQPTPPVVQAEQKVETVEQAREVDKIQRTRN